VGARRTAWLALVASKNAVIVEAALEAIDGHAELADAARSALVTALGDARPGVVATAAERVQKHPERAQVLSAKERRNALDPSAPPPSLHPAEEVDPALATALDAALAKTWTESFTETRAALLEAAVAVRLPKAKAAAATLCMDPNTTLLDHAQKALRALGDAKAACPAPPDMPVAPELASPHGGKLRFETDAGNLSIVLDPVLAPVASTRIVDLAKAGFFKGIVVHRVVPGFVAQFGDPGADGYGGADKLLRCETSPVPFGTLDVGVALAGRDTGSSQLFVTLGRVPHLDGDYARIGHAEGDWAAVSEGDVVRDVHVDDP
jgi:cyclophilin family peptidyl-prolyl cis-trans isomerase